MISSLIRSMAWLLFTGFGALFLLYGVYALMLPSTQPNHWDFLTFDRDTVKYIAGNFWWLGMISIGFGILTIAISLTSFRKGERWAWYAFWLFPLFFLLAIPLTWPGLAWSPFVLLSVLALVLNARQVFSIEESQ